MKLIDPKITLQSTDGDKLLISVECSDDSIERLSFSVLIERGPPNTRGRSVPQLLIAGCEAAQRILEALVAEARTEPGGAAQPPPAP